MKRPTLIARLLLPYRAEDDGRLQIDGLEHRMIQALGPRPGFDPEKNASHRAMAEERAREKELPALQAEVTAAEGELIRRGSHSWVPWVLAVLLLAEMLGGVMVARSIGFSGIWRLLLGICLGLGIIFFTCWLRAAATPEPGRRRSRVFWLLLAAYGILVLGLAFLRMTSGEDPDASLLARVASGVIVVFMTVLPAWAVEHLVRLLVGTRQAREKLRAARKRLSEVTRQVNDAKRAVAAIAHKAERWDHWEKQLRAVYLLHWRPGVKASGTIATAALAEGGRTRALPEGELNDQGRVRDR